MEVSKAPGYLFIYLWNLLTIIHCIVSCKDSRVFVYFPGK